MKKLNKTQIGKYTFYYCNEKEFRTLFDEIFNDEVYAFDSDNPEPLIFDCGSHIGLSTIYFKSRYPNSRIVAFEPDENNYKLLNKNVEENNLEQVEIYNYALSKKNGIESFWYESDPNLDSCGNTTTKWWGERFGFAEKKVKSVKLSDYINNPIDFLKIDVEGAEFDVLQDIKDQFHLIKNLIIEFHLGDTQIRKNKITTIENELTKNKFQFEEEYINIEEIIPSRYYDWAKKYNPSVCILKANSND